ncbi:MAG: DUF2500 family protein [Oscillospiraceae bacterium]|nr:DUF2500 family protein [Oscillospiraceae bacterium]
MTEYLFIGGLLLVCFAILLFSNTGGKTLTGPAMVVSRRVELAKVASRHSNNWNYLVTFRLSDGEELELYVRKQDYDILTEGLTGQLTWCRENLSSFEPDMEVSR